MVTLLGPKPGTSKIKSHLSKTRALIPNEKLFIIISLKSPENDEIPIFPILKRIINTHPTLNINRSIFNYGLSTYLSTNDLIVVDNMSWHDIVTNEFQNTFDEKLSNPVNNIALYN